MLDPTLGEYLNGSCNLQHSLELASTMSRLCLVSSSDTFAANEDSGHGSAAGDLLHVVLDLIAVGVVLYLHDLHLVGGDVVLLQHVLGLDTEGTVALGDDEDRLLSNFLVHGSFDRHADFSGG